MADTELNDDCDFDPRAAAALRDAGAAKAHVIAEEPDVASVTPEGAD